MSVQARALEGGFSDPVFDGQTIFRLAMDGMARPATIIPSPALAAPPEPLSPIMGALACTLLDGDTTYWLDDAFSSEPAIEAWIGFHTGARRTMNPSEAAFALIGAPQSAQPLAAFAQGTQEYPDQSTTLIMQVESFTGGTALSFAGPGIRTVASLAPAGLPDDFAAQWRASTLLFPRGVDLILVDETSIACLPRSARFAGSEA